MTRTLGWRLPASAITLPGVGRKGMVPLGGAKFCIIRPLIKQSARERYGSRGRLLRCVWGVARDRKAPCRRHSRALGNPNDRL